MEKTSLKERIKIFLKIENTNYSDIPKCLRNIILRDILLSAILITTSIILTIFSLNKSFIIFDVLLFLISFFMIVLKIIMFLRKEYETIEGKIISKNKYNIKGIPVPLSNTKIYELEDKNGEIHEFQTKENKLQMQKINVGANYIFYFGKYSSVNDEENLLYTNYKNLLAYEYISKEDNTSSQKNDSVS